MLNIHSQFPFHNIKMLIHCEKHIEQCISNIDDRPLTNAIEQCIKNIEDRTLTNAIDSGALALSHHVLGTSANDGNLKFCTRVRVSEIH